MGPAPAKLKSAQNAAKPARNQRPMGISRSASQAMLEADVRESIRLLRSEIEARESASARFPLKQYQRLFACFKVFATRSAPCFVRQKTSTDCNSRA